MDRVRSVMSWLLYVGPKRKKAITTGDGDVLRGREPTQMGWYEFASALAAGRTVLDVGCGSGEGLRVLMAKARTAIGIDLDGRLGRPDLDIQIMDVTEIPEKSFDVVVCVDVIEHVEADDQFVRNLARVARELVFASTPNFAVSRNRHPYHVREYTPDEFMRLFSPYGQVSLFGGDSTGDLRQEITRRWLYFVLNRLYSLRITLIAAKILKRLFFTKVWPHHAVVVTLGANVQRPVPGQQACGSRGHEGARVPDSAGGQDLPRTGRRT
jgi:SAM-dependent methyltransferase